jgi:hypothetical protein
MAWWRWPRFTPALVIGSGVPVLGLLALYLLGVPLGRRDYIYPYSPLASIYLLRSLPIPILLAALLAALQRVGATEPGRARTGLAAAATLYLSIAAWTFFEPLSYRGRYIFELESPSHEGAFTNEARMLRGGMLAAGGASVNSPAEYLRQFPTLLARTPEEMRGTRVLSNPPGVTMMALATARLFDACPALAHWFERHLPGGEGEDPTYVRWFAEDVFLAGWFHLAWMLAILPAYGLVRLWLPCVPAAVMAIGSVYNPATVNFTPGKDPAQLLTVMLFLYAWFAACLRRRPALGALAGIALVVGSLLSLVHIWIALIALAATLWHAMRGSIPRRHVLVNGAFPAVCGAAGVVLLAWLAWSWSMPATFDAVRRRYMEIQGEVIARPLLWNLMGLGLFVLFAGPGMWVGAYWAARGRSVDAVGRLGSRLLICAGIVLLYTYLFANNRETPRLWIPFIPVLLLGLALRVPVFRSAEPRAARLLAALLVMQVTVTVIHRALLDVRETELRLTTGRGYL